MKKILLILLTSLMLFSCGNSIMNLSQPVIITDIKTSELEGNCYYYGYGIEGSGWYVNKSKFEFKDKCGKFNVGDTIIITKQ
jgi:hypothetical protein